MHINKGWNEINILYNYFQLMYFEMGGTIIVLTLTFVLVILDEVFITSTLLIIHAFCWVFGYE